MEKLRGVSTNWVEVLNSAERLFSGGAPYLRLPVSVLYTVPPSLVSRQVDSVIFLPMIKLHDRDGLRYDEGLRAARELVRRRISNEDLPEVFGADAEKVVEKLIIDSGGYPRDLVRLLQSAIALPDLPATGKEIARILNEVHDAYRRTIPADSFAWIARVAKDKYLTYQDEDHRRVADKMLSINAVLRYLNDNEWFDLHPAVTKIPGVIDAGRDNGANA